MAAPHFPLSPADADLDARKHAARAEALAARAGCDPAWGAQLVAHVVARAPPPAGAVVSGFWPLAGEIDTLPLLRALAAKGHAIALPATPPRGEPLRFRLWREGEAMVRERFGTMRPTGPEIVPTFVLVPLLAFDRRGRRLGYGGGYYDRTLAALPGAGRLGVGFAAQEVDAVPAGPHDIRLPAVATERGIVQCDTA